MGKVSKVYLIRHGISEANLKGWVCGQVDSPLSPEGIQDLERIARAGGLAKITRLKCHTSHLKRTIQTANILGFKDLIHATELAETNTGEMSQKQLQEVNLTFPEFRHHNTDLNARYPGGESTGEMIDRAIKYFTRIEATTSDSEIAIVAHSGPLNAIMCHLLGIPFSSFPSIRIEHGKVNILKKPDESSLFWCLEKLNAEQV